MIELFDNRHVVLSKDVVSATTVTVATIGVRGERTFQYWYFDNMKPLWFDGVWDLIVEIRWLCDVEGCFFTCSFSTNQKVKCA